MTAIRLHEARKVYRYYPSRGHRLKEWLSFGLRSYATDVAALRDVSFTIKAGESVGVIGRNGAGKSTLLRVLAGISPLTSGIREVQGSVSAMIELGAQFHPDYTGRENVAISGIMLGLSRRDMEARLPTALEFAELGDQIDHPLRTYSSGMQARLAFAASTMIRPEVLLVDEVLAVGDQYFVGRCVRYIQQYQRTGRTMVLVSHDLTLIHALCRRVMWLDQGRIVADGASTQVCSAYRRSVQEEENEKAKVRSRIAGSSGPSPEASDPAGRITITDVALLGGWEEARVCFMGGDQLTISVAYHARIRYPNPNISITIERSDGVMMTAHSTKDAELDSGVVEPGEGAFDVVYSPLMLGPGVYRVHVAITLDDLLAYNDTNFDRIEGAREFQVMAAGRPYPVAIEHPVVWKRGGRPLGPTLARTTHGASTSSSSPERR
ncbi:MAG: ABC transporter ATP-binding protein [Nitrospira sp.]|nr:MAG: ABC transporter ATP-binding protein [Nitrospira sp.]